MRNTEGRECFVFEWIVISFAYSLLSLGKQDRETRQGLEVKLKSVCKIYNDIHPRITVIYVIYVSYVLLTRV